MSNPYIKYSITLPCYNEEQNIPSIFERFQDALGARSDIEVILVNNGSTDNSGPLLAREQEKPENGFAKVVTVTKNQGYGYGILSGLKESKGDFLGWTHADLQTDPLDIVRAVDVFEHRDDAESVLLKGKRINRKLFDGLFTGGMSIVSSLALESKLSDVNAQPKIFHRSFYQSMVDNAPYGFSLDLYILYQANALNLRIIELPVSFEKRLHGESKGGGTIKGKVKLIRRTWAYIFELRKKLR
jgi:glycosyltransferase involved in cell wall biosynthesis